MSTAVSYEDHVERLNRTYAGCWHLIVQAHDLARLEHLFRLKVSIDMSLARGTKAPPLWSESNLWECLFRLLVKDAEFWSQQVHIPANAWLAHGTKQKLLTPAEAIASTSIQGGLNTIEGIADCKETRQQEESAAGGAGPKSDRKKGRGKGKEKSQACYAWNNN
eukprot:s503_g28.t1